ARVEPPPASGQEERVLGAAGESRAPVAEVQAEAVRRLLAERHDAVLAALSAHVHGLAVEVDVSEIEADRLVAAEAGRVDELDERRSSSLEPDRERLQVEAVGATGRLPEPRRGEKALDRVSHLHAPLFAPNLPEPAENFRKPRKFHNCHEGVTDTARLGLYR